MESSHTANLKGGPVWAFRHLKPAEIARKIGKHRSVIAREVARSGSSLADHNPQQAQKRACQRKAANATAAIHEAIARGPNQGRPSSHKTQH